MVKVSVIVPVYNVEKYLEKCAESILGQTLTDIEVILVDDGSPDSSGKICDRFAQKDKRVKVIHKKNGGVSAARNDGLQSASGEYVIFVDSDDWMELDACEAMYKTAKVNNADIVIGDVNRIKDDESKLMRLFKEEFVIQNKKDIEQLIISVLYPANCELAANKKTGYGGPWNKLVRRTLITDIDLKFEPSVGGICDDRIYNLTAYANAKKIVYIQKAVYNYVYASGSITKSFKPNIFSMNCNMFALIVRLLDSFYDLNLSYTDGISGRKEWGEAINSAYHSFVMWRMDDAVRLYIFNPKNKADLRGRLSDLKSIMAEEPYLTASKDVKRENMPMFTQLVTLGARIKCPIFVLASFQLYKVMRKMLR